MAYSVNWITKVITIPQSDLTLIGGSTYGLDASDLHAELGRLVWDFADGLWADQIYNWYETVTISGIAKSPSLEFTNGYTLTFTGSNYAIIVSGFDTNIFDVYIPVNGVGLLSVSSVGKVTSGSGLSASQDLKLTEMHKADFNRRKHDKVANEVILYDDDKVTPYKVFDADDELTDITPQ